jgi:hypothetical protein
VGRWAWFAVTVPGAPLRRISRIRLRTRISVPRLHRVAPRLPFLVRACEIGTCFASNVLLDGHVGGPVLRGESGLAGCGPSVECHAGVRRAKPRILEEECSHVLRRDLLDRSWPTSLFESVVQIAHSRPQMLRVRAARPAIRFAVINQSMSPESSESLATVCTGLSQLFTRTTLSSGRGTGACRRSSGPHAPRPSD